MKQYQKIQTVYYRDPDNKFKTLLEGVWAKPEFELLKDIRWVWTEKVDGTNIRIQWDGENVTFAGKSDNAQIPDFLLRELQNTFTSEKMLQTFPDANNVCLYGEGFGKKIQKGHHYISDGVSFILFDVFVEKWWLSRENCEAIANSLEVSIVPIIGSGSLTDAIQYVKNGYKSTISQSKDLIAEGLILKPSVELNDRKGDRVIAKVKYKDFKR